MLQKRSPIRHFTLQNGYNVALTGRSLITGGPRLIKTLTPAPENLVPFPPAGPTAPICAPATVAPRPREVRL